MHSNNNILPRLEDAAKCTKDFAFDFKTSYYIAITVNGFIVNPQASIKFTLSSKIIHLEK